MVESKFTVRHKVGLHARPAAMFVQTANKFSSSIKVQNLTTNGRIVDAKSIIMVLTLGVMKDHEIQIQAEGGDEVEALAALTSLVENNFGEA
jgi:phosphotransferase system HPr (HPr) family protein